METANVTEVLCESLPYFPGQRHHLTLALAGWLRKRGYTKGEVEEIVKLVALCFNDDEIDERIHNVQTTFEQDLNNVAGWKMLMEIIGEEAAKELDARIPRIFLYTDEFGTPLFRVLRWDKPEGKTFKTQNFDGKEWKDGLGNARKVLYRLPEVIKAIKNDYAIFIVEGEKCVHAMEKLGLTATTNPFGAGKWLDDFTKQLTGAKEVVIIPDMDEAGRKHAEKVKESLEKHNIPERIVELPNLGEGEDIADWLSREGSRDRLLELIESSQETQKRPVVQVFGVKDFLQYAESLGSISWLVDSLIPENGIVLISGRPKRGKSTLARQLLTGVAVPNKALSLNKSVKQSPVVITAGEDFPQAVAQHLLNLGALQDSPISIALPTSFTEDWQELLQPFEGKLVLLDPAPLFLKIRDVNDYVQVYDRLAELKAFAKSHDMTLVLTWHDRKPAKGDSTEAMDAVLGSTATTGAVDVVANLLKPVGAPPTSRQLAIKSRLSGESIIDLQFENGLYTVQDTEGLSAFAMEVLDFLKKYPGATANAIRQAFYRSGTAVAEALEALRNNALAYFMLRGNKVEWYAVEKITILHEGKRVT
ncbi:Toprim domain/AAA domain [Thermoanaerobacter sp. YS13]|uniref:AAA family ATPase n=1 Tax=Thermoanaerobacter sp. YS13 TaxID=1511746 RepID=UPI0005732179|nr:AAA family ATPase [Thermoanaerobacter sp. YS13]KHO62699.1 Toprim domain/AAA domain [Thermoanaerobacter sp. YS13]